jgi:hypothetical protein
MADLTLDLRGGQSRVRDARIAADYSGIRLQGTGQQQPIPRLAELLWTGEGKEGRGTVGLACCVDRTQIEGGDGGGDEN